MYERSAHVYDEIYADKDYTGEADRLHALIQERRPGARTLLDVACGTGRHLAALGDRYEVEGIDLTPALLAVARSRLPDVPLHEADMRELDLGRSFDAVTCLFSAVGHLPSVGDLERAVAAMARHVAPGGVLAVEPWILPEDWIEGHVSAECGGRVARVTRSWREGRTSTVEFHYAVPSPDGIECWTERHATTLFAHDEYLSALRAAGLEPEHDAHGLFGRGLYLGVRRCPEARSPGTSRSRAGAGGRASGGAP